MFQTLAYYATAFHRSFVNYTTAKLQTLGLNFGSLFLVIYVGKHPGCTQTQLTSDLNLDWGYSQRSVTKLVEEGFLTREKSGRCYHLNLSDKGQQAFEVSHQVFFDWDEQVLSALSLQEREQLFTLLAKAAQKEVDSICTKPSTAQ
ncbi:bilirubin utilization transcriptional regulator BilQ [Negativibacillus massiliensis]|uniref:bilirubin utilization transcriptional regulator BilQ n=1 Tax=Negativibacillus massiliensis TaxID=1871035 RepID=UPI0003406891|nr:bilirubin utilization transcriptional regulator BilQ [Negativibacillus massiliensis]MBS5138255.1 winged helix-turn-helix transcriptional regulator [Clostridium sp.]MCI6348195.1 MarR family winged helix-turn-helix transcriptional regulator [Negativibacillus massiliensis]CDA76083.1 putative transcriptional regulator (MarR/EmrR family) [Clostridium sp. CAG:242]